MIGREYKIEKIKRIREDIALLRIRCDLNPQPGQFLEVSLPGIGECPLASRIYDKNHIELIARKVGSVTSALFQLNAGDKIFIRGPYGKGFPVGKLRNMELILASGGTGIVPVSSLIDYCDKSGIGNITAYLSFRDEEYIPIKDKLIKWKNKFNIIVCLDQTNNKNYRRGFVQDIISKAEKNSIVFLCGPEIMMKAITEKLNKLGIENNKIYWSIERRMECGMGSCGRCLLQDVYVCKDGPVFRYDKIKPKLDNEEASNKIQG